MENNGPGLEELNQLVRDLLARVSRLEQIVGAPSPDVSTAQHQATSRNAIASPSASPDLESRIGSQWLNRIGIVAVLIGVSFFLKYAFESQLIGPAGRVGLGLLGGIAVIAASEIFRRRGYRVFSFSLKALGLGILYLSLWAAFQVYDLISWLVAFLAMVTVTVSTAVLALSQDAEVLALFALVGGYLTPVLLYTGDNREIELFTYLVLLSLATLILSVSRPWQRLVLVSLLATNILYIGWYASFYRPRDLDVTLSFATVFFVIFAVAPILESIFRPASNRWHIALSTSLLNAVAYFLGLYLFFGRTDTVTMAWSAAGLAAIYTSLSLFLPTKAADPLPAALQRLHFSLGTALLAIAIAIGFESKWISLGWFVESTILMSLGFWRKSPFLRWQALAILALTIGKVFTIDIWNLDRGYRIISFVALGVLLLGISFLYQRDWLRRITSNVR